MKTVAKKLYEAMFLVDSGQAAADWDASLATIKNILERAKAKIVSIRKWDECKLAYEINGKTRGTYILCYFRADGKKIRDIERDVQLSERIMRVLILSAEAREKEDIEKDTPAERAEKYKPRPSEELGKQKAAQAAAERAEAKQVSAQRAEEAKEPEPAAVDTSPAPDRSGASESEQPETKDFEPADEQSEQKADRRQRTEKSDI